MLQQVFVRFKKGLHHSLQISTCLTKLIFTKAFLLYRDSNRRPIMLFITGKNKQTFTKMPATNTFGAPALQMLFFNGHPPQRQFETSLNKKRGPAGPLFFISPY